MAVVDLFCGCGGLSLGFQYAGFDIVRAFDNWDKAVNIYNANFEHEAELCDVYDLTSQYLEGFHPNVIIGGPPCQDYSSAGMQDETRGRADLTLRFAELVCGVTPRWFVMENVDRITKSATLLRAIEMFRTAGYGLTQVVLDASRCGVPQKRKRFFLLGELNGQDGFLRDELINNQAARSMTIRDYLGDEFGTDYYYRHPRSYARRAIFSVDEPSPTVRGVNRPIPNTYNIHPGDATDNLELVRPLTTLERARIQTFPRIFEFEGSKTDLEQIIGNAVPVELATYVGRHLLNYIRQHE
jgi:DNA (cytosine-5)-methyltransferase 1